MEASQVPINRQVDLKSGDYIHIRILPRRKKEWNLILCHSMNGPGGHYAKRNKSVRERQMQINKIGTDLQLQRMGWWSPEGRGLGNGMKKEKGWRSTDGQWQNSHGDVKCGIGNIVNNTVIATYGAKWVLDLLGGPLCKVHDYLTTILYTWN